MFENLFTVQSSGVNPFFFLGVVLLMLAFGLWWAQKSWSAARGGLGGCVVMVVFWFVFVIGGILVLIGIIIFLTAGTNLLMKAPIALETGQAAEGAWSQFWNWVGGLSLFGGDNSGLVGVGEVGEADDDDDSDDSSMVGSAVSTATPGPGVATSTPESQAAAHSPEYRVEVQVDLKQGTDLDQTAWEGFVRRRFFEYPHSTSLPKGWTGKLLGKYGFGFFYKNRFWLYVISPSGLEWVEPLTSDKDREWADSILKVSGEKEKGEGLVWVFNGTLPWPPEEAECPFCYTKTETLIPLPTPAPTPTPEPESVVPTPTLVPATAAECVKVVSVSLNIRAGPGTNNIVVGSASKGDVFPTFEQADNSWWRIGIDRWISGNSQYVQETACP